MINTPDASEVSRYNPLALAYVGDSVYDLYVRTVLVTHGDQQMRTYHHLAVDTVRATAQADAVRQRVLPVLTETELAVFKRGRNAKSATVAKNANVVSYRLATGLETLLGYLYLSGQQERLEEILHYAAPPTCVLQEPELKE